MDLTTKKAQVGVISLIVFAVMVIVGVIVYDSINTSFTATGSALAVKNNVSANTFSAFNLVAVGPIIFGAVIILGIVGLLYMRGG